MTEKRRDHTLIVTVLMALLSLFVSGWVGYTHNDKEVASRISVVETQQLNDGSAIRRIETKMDRLEDKFDDMRDAILQSIRAR